MKQTDTKLNEYSQTDAGLYAQLAIDGTTYEYGFRPAARLLGDLSGKTVLDFGSGSGRSSRFLHGLGATRVIGVDHNTEMVAAALRVDHPGVEYKHIGADIPQADGTIDAVFSSCAFIEMNDRTHLAKACSEIARVLRRGGQFVLLSGNPESFACRYASFSYGHQPPFEPGKAYCCEINVAGKTVHVYDTFWSEEDYRGLLEPWGMRITQVEYPTAEHPASWHIDEGRVSPFMLLRAVKQG